MVWLSSTNFTCSILEYFVPFGLLFPGNPKKTHTGQSTLQVFFFTVKKETTNEPSKVLTRKNLFLQCYWSVLFISVIGTTCFDIFFHDNWKVLFFEKDYCWLEVLSNRHVLTFFEINNLKEIRILSFTSKIAVESNTKTPKWSSRMSYLVDSFNCCIFLMLLILFWKFSKPL